MSQAEGTSEISTEREPRRGFLQRWPSLLMAFGLTAGYGMFASVIVRFMFPRRREGRQPQFVADLGSFPTGKSMTYVSPAGERVVLTRMSEGEQASDFIALSSVCPHLGCQVHWEGQNDRFFCPCHNGAFDAEGNPLSGPVKDAQQSLPRFDLIVKNGLLFIDVTTEALVEATS